jgi:DNA-binding SARP family transcriptional activator
MRFGVLGPLEVVGPEGPIPLGSRRQRAILALLVLHSGETVSSERLIDEVWGDTPPAGARHALEVQVGGLRRTIGAEWIETHPGGYRLRTVGADVDLARFERHLADASRATATSDPRSAAAALGAALSLWRGPALEDIASVTAVADRARLEELRAVATERRIDAELACGRHVDVLPELRRLVAEAPMREAFQWRLMLALYRSGRQAEALEAYHAARVSLDRELGVNPGPELERLQRAILDHDPALAPPAATSYPGLPVAREPAERRQAGIAPIVPTSAGVSAGDGRRTSGSSISPVSTPPGVKRSRRRMASMTCRR